MERLEKPIGVEKAPDPIINNVGEEETIEWLKVSGTFRLPDRRLIRPGQTFFAKPSEIPIPFRDTIKPLRRADFERSLPTPPEKLQAKSHDYKAVPRDDKNAWFDIVDGNGKIVSEKALRKEEAEEQIKSMKE